jgi:hypothetical protein
MASQSVVIPKENWTFGFDRTAPLPHNPRAVAQFVVDPQRNYRVLWLDPKAEIGHCRGAIHDVGELTVTLTDIEVGFPVEDIVWGAIFEVPSDGMAYLQTVTGYHLK